jgi:hypothetical protein
MMSGQYRSMPLWPLQDGQLAEIDNAAASILVALRNV